MDTATPVRVASLSDLDALVGKNVTHESPRVFWEDSNAFLRFDSREEAIAALQNPAYRGFIPKNDWETAALKEVERYAAYSTDLNQAWQMMEEFCASRDCVIKLMRRGGCWHAAFEGFSAASAPTVSLALCLAVLRACGIEPVCDQEAAGGNRLAWESP